MAFLPTAAESMFRNHEDGHYPTLSPCVPQDFHGASDFLMRRSMSFSVMDRAEEFQADDDVSDDGSQMLGEKKRRLDLAQVKALEKNFELGNKLEPERKIQLARALGLQPRQIAIWFQNRRARCKTKQLEKDFDILKRQFDALKADNHDLKSQNKKLQTRLLALKTRVSTGSGQINLNKENEGSWINGSENSCAINLKATSTDSALFPHQRNKHAAIFPAAVGPASAATLAQLVHNSPRPDHHVTVSNECVSNMFGGIEENPEFWPWPEQQIFH